MAVATARRNRSTVAYQEESQRGFFGFIGQSFHFLLAFAVVASAIAPTLQLDSFVGGTLLTYPPRLILAVFAGVLMLSYAVYGQLWRFMLMLACGALLINDAGWASSKVPEDIGADHTLVSINVHHQVDRAERLATLCEELNADFVCLQEVSLDQHDEFTKQLGRYKFFSADESKEFEFSKQDPFTNLVGVKRSLLQNAKTDAATIETAITGYRTFAVKVALRNGPVWLVNVHSTKSFVAKEGVAEAVGQAITQAQRHRHEADQLREWLATHHDAPILIAGDFNSPINSYNMRFDGLLNAQKVAGHGVHRTFPRTSAIWGIDHILGTRDVKFEDYQIVDFGFSDHMGQVAKFSLLGKVSSEDGDASPRKSTARDVQ